MRNLQQENSQTFQVARQGLLFCYNLSMVFTKKELDFIQDFIDNRFDGVDCSDTYAFLMESSGLLTPNQRATVSYIKNTALSRMITAKEI